MKVFVLKHERVVETSFEEALKNGAPQAHRSSIWFRAINPDEITITALSDSLHLPIEEFHEFLKQDERPRLDFGKHIQLILRVPFLEDGSVITAPVSIFIHKHWIVTLEKEKTTFLDYIENVVLQNKRKFLFTRPPPSFLAYFIDRANDEFFAKTDKIADTLELFRTSERMSKEMMKKVYALSVTLSFFNQALIANIEVLNTLRKLPGRIFSIKNKEEFAELYYDALQIFDAAKVQREIVLHLFNLQSIISTAKLNEYLKRLTVLALIIMIPTLISGVYGMNIPLPFMHSPHAFYIVIGFMLAATLIGIGIFKILERM